MRNCVSDQTRVGRLMEHLCSIPFALRPSAKSERIFAQYNFARNGYFVPLQFPSIFHRKKRISLPSLFSEKSLYATIIYHTESDFFLEICIVKFTVGYIILDPFRLQFKKIEDRNKLLLTITFN